MFDLYLIWPREGVLNLDVLTNARVVYIKEVKGGDGSTMDQGIE